MAEPRYDVEMLARVTAAAARMQSEREAQRNSPRDAAFTAEEMDRMAVEVGIDPALMRQALGQVTAAQEARRRYTRQTMLAVVACLLFLGAGAIFGYKLFVNAENLGYIPNPREARAVADATAAAQRYREQSERADLAAAQVTAAAIPPPNAPWGPNDEKELQRLIEIENSAYAARDYRVLRRLYDEGYRLRTRRGETFHYPAVMQTLQELPQYPADWRRDAALQKLSVSGNRAFATQSLSVRYTDRQGFLQNQQWQMVSTWRRIGGQWLKFEDREL